MKFALLKNYYITLTNKQYIMKEKRIYIGVKNDCIK